MSLPDKWVTVDVGETTGYAIWTKNQLTFASDAPLWQFVLALGWLLTTGTPEVAAQVDTDLRDRLHGWALVVIEDWQLYEWEALNLAWDKQDTVRGLGAMQFIAIALGRPYELQPATIKEAAKSAGAEDLFRRPLTPNRHANDAIMHGVHYAAQAGEGVAEAS